MENKTVHEHSLTLDGKVPFIFLRLIMYHRIVIAILALLLLSAEAAPPIGGTPTLEDSVKRGCKLANVVVIARIVNLQIRPEVGGEFQTGDIQVLELLKGLPGEVPSKLIDFKNIPPLTDSLWQNHLEDQMTYLIFLGAPAVLWGEIRIPMLQYDPQSGKYTNQKYLAAVSMAKAACRS